MSFDRENKIMYHSLTYGMRWIQIYLLNYTLNLNSFNFMPDSPKYECKGSIPNKYGIAPDNAVPNGLSEQGCISLIFWNAIGL